MEHSEESTLRPLVFPMLVEFMGGADDPPPPVPVDEAAAAERVSAIVEWCRTAEPADRLGGDLLEQSGAWESFATGCRAEELADGAKLDWSLRVAIASITLAANVHDIDRLRNNLLTLGGIYFRMKDNDAAIIAFRHAIRLPYWGNSRPRRVAQMNLSSAALMRWSESKSDDKLLFEGLKYYEHAMRFRRSQKPGTTNHVPEPVLKAAYSKIGDLAGVALVHRLRGGDPIVIILKDLPSENPATPAGRWKAMRLATRLRAAGLSDVAERVEKWWNQNRVSTGE